MLLEIQYFQFFWYNRDQTLYLILKIKLMNVMTVSNSLAQISTLEQYAMRSFSEALEAIPLALAENSGLPPIHTLADIKSRQVKENNPKLGIDCLNKGSAGECLCSDKCEIHERRNCRMFSGERLPLHLEENSTSSRV